MCTMMQPCDGHGAWHPLASPAGFICVALGVGRAVLGLHLNFCRLCPFAEGLGAGRSLSAVRVLTSGRVRWLFILRHLLYAFATVHCAVIKQLSVTGQSSGSRTPWSRSVKGVPASARMLRL